ncbi:Flp family type IVb pilin [Thalassoroseus pseudoceratinae]|uniref:Flp family type IVb pilin n=1 Tax=Thalassoroseus pseudoceratinae TaxID=2713176 RepID=UPI001422CE32|nr:Flp family type IVb pilin [Thalassoroseus pseudoceratinae]
MKPIQAFFTEDNAATAVEYAVMLAMILLSIIAAISQVGGASGSMWDNNSTQLKNAGF